MKNWDNERHEQALQRRKIKKLMADKASVEEGKYDTDTDTHTSLSPIPYKWNELSAEAIVHFLQS